MRHPLHDVVPGNGGSEHRTAGAGQIVLDDAPERVDRDALWAFLSTGAYWGRWRTRADVEAQLAAAWRVVGAYHARTGEMVACARAVSDGVAFAYLADLYVIPGWRGHGLGTALVRVMIDLGPGAGFRWALHTDDAHGLYRRFGFRAPDATYLERPGQHAGRAPEPDASAPAAQERPATGATGDVGRPAMCADPNPDPQSDIM